MSPRELAYCSVFGAAAFWLPVVFHLLHLGHIFMPMYLPLMALAFFVRPPAAALTALSVPLLSGAMTGMPPLMPPIAPVMAIELAIMALLAGLLRTRLPRLPLRVVLAVVLIIGRLINLGLMLVAAHVLVLSPTLVAGFSLLSGWPGILLMMAVIPQLMRLAIQHNHMPL